MTPQASAAPVQRNAKTMPKCSSEERRRAPPAEGQEQQVAGHDRRQDERQVDRPSSSWRAPEAPARQRQSHQDAEGQARHVAPGGNLEAEPDGHNLVR